MGKSRPRNRIKNRDNPAGRPVKPPSDPELAALREKRILPVLQDLKSIEPKTRATAASAICNIIEDVKCRKLLLREQIVKILLEQTLTDSNLETRTAGWGILRNLALEEEADFSVHLFRQDILTAIEGAVNTIIQTVESQEYPLEKLPRAQQTLVWTLSASIINLLSSLTEAQDEITEAVCKVPAIINFLFGILNISAAISEVKTEALLCLMVLVEDNKELAERTSQNLSWLTSLTQLKGSTDSYTAVASCGVLHKLFAALAWFDHNTPVEGASDAVLIPTLVNTLENVSDEERKPDADEGRETTSSSISNGLPPAMKARLLALEVIASIAASLQEALEHGAKHEKVFEGFKEEDMMDADESEGEELGEEKIESDNESDEMTQEEIEADMEMVTRDEAGNENNGQLEEMTLNRLVRQAAPSLLLLAQQPRQGPQREDDLLQVHAVSALNNVAWTISSIDFSSTHLEKLKEFWSKFAQSVWDQVIAPVLTSNTADVEVAAAITSLAWAVARSLQGAVNIKFDEQKNFMSLYHASKALESTPESLANKSKTSESDDNDQFQGLGVKCIGVLGSLAMYPAPVELNREIGVFLITILGHLPEVPAADAVEALNQIFDMYADKDYEYDEVVFWKDGFIKHLEDAVPKAKKMAKAIDKRKFPELRARADEANLNLARFLKYKHTERKE